MQETPPREGPRRPPAPSARAGGVARPAGCAAPGPGRAVHTAETPGQSVPGVAENVSVLGSAYGVVTRERKKFLSLDLHCRWCVLRCFLARRRLERVPRLTRPWPFVPSGVRGGVSTACHSSTPRKVFLRGTAIRATRWHHARATCSELSARRRA